MDFFDDETSRAPADAGGPPSAPTSRRRPADNRRRTRVQRLVILAVVLFAVVFGIAWWARSCQHNRKVDTYRGYYTGVAAAIDDSAGLGKKVSAIMKDPARLSRKELIAELDQLAAQQEEIAVRAGRLEPPSTLEEEQSVFATGMRVRASGFELLRTAMVGALGDKKVGVKDITALDGYFSGPDAYYQELAYLPARETLADEGVSDVAVPTSTYFLTWKALDPGHASRSHSRASASRPSSPASTESPSSTSPRRAAPATSSWSAAAPTTSRPRPTCPSSSRCRTRAA